jgi:ribosomal protein L44E
MSEHYTSNTLGCTAYCNRCGRFTAHAVSGNRKGRCTEHEARRLTHHQQRDANRREAERRNPRLF